MITAMFTPAPELEFLRVKEAMKTLQLGRTKFYELIRSGRLASVTEGRARLIPVTAIRAYAALLEKEAESTR